MIEIVICDDSETDRKEMQRILMQICAEEAIDYELRVYSTGQEMLMQTHSMDIGLLDISMEEMNGIDLGRELKKKYPDVKLIYTTSYARYCQQVINTVHAFSFLVKPISYESVKSQLLELLNDMEEDISGRKREFYNVQTADKQNLEVLKLALKDILYFEYIKMARRIKIVCRNESYEFPYVMEKLAEELEDSGFGINCRGMLVNLRHIRKIKGYTLYLDNDQTLTLSQKRKAEFIKQMNRFMQKNYNWGKKDE